MEGSLVAYKVFTNGSTLQASELNENLMQQVTSTFSNASARTSAIPSPVEGQMTYILDTDQIEVWSGSAWVRRVSTTLPFATTANIAFLTGVTTVTFPSGRFSQEPVTVMTPIFSGTNTGAYFPVLLGSSSSSMTAYCIRHDATLVDGVIYFISVQMTAANGRG